MKLICVYCCWFLMLIWLRDGKVPLMVMVMWESYLSWLPNQPIFFPHPFIIQHTGKIPSYPVIIMFFLTSNPFSFFWNVCSLMCCDDDGKYLQWPNVFVSSSHIIVIMCFVRKSVDGWIDQSNVFRQRMIIVMVRCDDTRKWVWGWMIGELREKQDGSFGAIFYP